MAAAAERRKAQREEAVKRAAEKVEVTQVDVVIKQSVTFEKGQVVCEDAAIPALVRATPNLAECCGVCDERACIQIAVAEVMKDHPGSKLNVRGRPDRADGGDADFQCRIAADRAEAVCDWLVAQGSISLSRLRTSYEPSAATLLRLTTAFAPDALAGCSQHGGGRGGRRLARPLQRDPRDP